MTDDQRYAERIYRAIFRDEPPQRVVERFIPAARRLRQAAGPEELARYLRILDCAGDLEALEVAARYRRMLPLLRAEFRIMVYLAEAEPANQRFFVKRRNGRLSAYASISLGAVVTTLKLLKGSFILARMRHV